MRYAIFTDIHANLEALEAVLAKIDAISDAQPVDQIWFLGDLVGYGPDPNECIRVLRERTDIIIAGNHDWAAVGKIDLEDFSPAARISAEWTATTLTEEHRDFLTNLPERIEIGDCTLVHGSPYGPLWEYLTSEALAERSFLHFSSRYCLVGHTHVPVIFIQPDVTNTPTLPLANAGNDVQARVAANGTELHTTDGAGEIEGDAADDDDETVELLIIPSTSEQSLHVAPDAGHALSAYQDPESGSLLSEEDATSMIEKKLQAESAINATSDDGTVDEEDEDVDVDESTVLAFAAADEGDEDEDEDEDEDQSESVDELDEIEDDDEYGEGDDEDDDEDDETTEIARDATEEGSEAQINVEIEELLNLLGLSQSMVQVTNEMLSPPEGHWEAPPDFRAIINPGGVGQPRDGDPRAAFMIYDTERGFEFYRIPYDFEKTQEKIIEAGLPQFLAVRLAYGR